MALALFFAPVRAFAEEQASENDITQTAIEVVETAAVDEPAVELSTPVPEQTVIVETSQDTTNVQVAVTDTADATVIIVADEPTSDGAIVDEQPVDPEAVETDVTDAALPTIEETPATDTEAASDGEAIDTETTTENNQAIAESLGKEEEEIAVLADPGEEIAEGDYVIEAGIETDDNTGLVGLVLDARGGASEGTRVISWKYSGKDNQKWHVKSEGDGWYSISAYTDHSLVITATNDSGKLYLTKYQSGLASQLWRFVLSGTSYGTGYQIMPKGIQKSATDKTIVNSSPKKAIDVRGNSSENGADIITYTKSDEVKGNQTYYLVNPNPVKPTSGLTDMEGKYRLQVPSKTSVVVEIRKESSDNGANVWLYTASGKAHQDVYLQHEGNGFYSMWIMGTKKVLDVRDRKSVV